MRLRAKIDLSPETCDLSRLRVAFSYKTEEWRTARRIARRIAKLGFQIVICPPERTSRSGFAEQDTKQRLRDLFADADYACVIVSKRSLDSQWVSYEYQQAVERIGRVVFVVTGESPTSDGFQIVDWLHARRPEREFFIKHTTVCFNKPSGPKFGQAFRVSFPFVPWWGPRLKEFARNIAFQLINSPDEGWFEENEPDSNELIRAFRERDLALESQLRRYARHCVLEDRKYANRCVLEVLPFTWDSIRCPIGDIEGALHKVVRMKGLQRLEDAILSGAIEFSHARYPVVASLGVADADIDALVGLEPLDRPSSLIEHISHWGARGMPQRRGPHIVRIG